jgi:signal recognition particle receptor subunit beta
MAHVDADEKLIRGKVVYFGPSQSGKTANLRHLSRKMARGELMSLTAEGCEWDYLPVDLGFVGGIATSFKLYTVPGLARGHPARGAVIAAADGIIFVADSSPDRLEANIESFEELRIEIIDHDLDPELIPIVVQYNKRDLPDALDPDVLNDALLGRRNLPVLLASAIDGSGVYPTLDKSLSLVFARLRKAYGTNRPAPAPQATGAPERREAGPNYAELESRVRALEVVVEDFRAVMDLERRRRNAPPRDEDEASQMDLLRREVAMLRSEMHRSLDDLRAEKEDKTSASEPSADEAPGDDKPEPEDLLSRALEAFMGE